MAISDKVNEISLETEDFQAFANEECDSVQANINDTIDSVVEEINPIFDEIKRIQSHLEEQSQRLIDGFNQFKSS